MSVSFLENILGREGKAKEEDEDEEEEICAIV